MSRIDLPCALSSSTRSMMSSSRLGLTPAAGSSSRIACGIGHQHARQLEELALAAGEHPRRLALEAGQRDEVEQRARLVDRRALLRRDAAGPQEVRPDALAGLVLARRSARSRAPSSRRKGRGIWKVRPTPRADAPLRALAARRRGRRCGSRRMSACRLPASRLNSVVLPAPFGPISPTISPRRERDRHAVDGAHAAERA